MKGSNFDPTQYVFDLLLQSAPEREAELHELWAKYSIRLEVAPDRKGILMNADKDRIQFACKDIQILWLLGFSLWESIKVFSPVICLPGKLGFTSESVLKGDKKLDEFERDYSERLRIIGGIIDADGMDEALWIPDIPKPERDRLKLQSVQHKAVFDIVLMAVAVVLLHEVRHVQFHKDHLNGHYRPLQLAEEEMACDVWARDWFTAKLGQYASAEGHKYGRVYSKRSMALLLVCEFLRLAEKHAGTIGSIQYPPLAERISALSGNLSLRDEDNFWVFSACVLLAELRRNGYKSLEIPAASPKELTLYFIEKLTPAKTFD